MRTADLQAAWSRVPWQCPRAWRVRPRAWRVRLCAWRVRSTRRLGGRATRYGAAIRRRHSMEPLLTIRRGHWCHRSTGHRMRSAPRLLPPRRRTVGFAFASWPLSRGRSSRLRPRLGGHLRRITQIEAAALTPDTFDRLAGAKASAALLSRRRKEGPREETLLERDYE